MVESHSPYYLHPSEGPEGLIAAVIIEGANYDLWITDLKAKNKLGFIDGTLRKPEPKMGEDTTKLQTWDMVN